MPCTSQHSGRWPFTPLGAGGRQGRAPGRGLRLTVECRLPSKAVLSSPSERDAGRSSSLRNFQFISRKPGCGPALPPALKLFV